jgi:hypothetical protein
MWATKSKEQKLEMIRALNAKRTQLKVDAQRSRTSSTRKVKSYNIKFKSKELEDLFNAIPSDIKRKLF